MPAWLAIALKDLRSLSRDRMGLFWVFGFPVAFALFFGSILRAAVDDRTAEMRVVVVEETGDSRRADSLALQLSVGGVHVERGPAAEARERVRRGELGAFVRVAPQAAGLVSIGIDPMRRSEAAMLEGLVLRALAPEYAPFVLDPPEVALERVVGTRAGPRSGYELVFPAMLLWGLMGCVATFSVALVVERGQGTLLRLRAAPLSAASVLAGKAAGCLFACILAALWLSALGLSLFEVRLEEPLKLGVALLAAALCFCGMTLVLSTFGHSEQAVAGAGWSALIVMAMLGGAMVPPVLMPDWLTPASQLSPVRWAIQAFEGATFRNDDWPALLRPLSLLAGLGSVTLLAGALRLGTQEP